MRLHTTLVAVALMVSLPSGFLAQQPPPNNQPPGGAGSASAGASTATSGSDGQQTYAPSSSRGFGGSASASSGSGPSFDASNEYDDVWTMNPDVRGSSRSSASGSESAGSSDVSVGEASGSSGEWWLPDDPATDSGDWETRPLTWMGEFVPEWTDDMPYPALGTVFRPTFAGQKELRGLRKFRFNDSGSVAPLSLSPDARRNRGECPRRFCLNVSIRSDYGALTDFEAFVMDRFESKTELVADAFDLEHPSPLVRGQIRLDELKLVFGDGDGDGNGGRYSGSFGSYGSDSSGGGDSNYGDDSSYGNDSSNGSGSDGGWQWLSESEYSLLTDSATHWLLYPRHDRDADKVDVTMSFKQLYTLLPGYDAVTETTTSAGPFYSDDPNDQVVLRLVGERASEYSASSALFPLVMSTTGSTLFDIEYASYQSENSLVINVDISFKRKRYGAIPPWVPGDVSEKCKAQTAQLMENEEVSRCLEQHLSDSAFRRQFANAAKNWEAGWSRPISHAVDMCFGLGFLQTASSDHSWSSQGDGSISSRGTSLSRSVGSPSSSSASDNVGFEVGSNFTNSRYEALQVVKQADEAVRNLIEANCSIGSRSFGTSAGLMNVLAYEPSRAKAASRAPQFYFFLSLELGDASFRTPRISNRYVERQIRRMIQSSIPNASEYELDIFVRVGDNLELIAEIERQNERIRQHMPHEASSSSSSSSTSVGDGPDVGGSFDGNTVGRPWRRLSDRTGDPNSFRDWSSSSDGVVGADVGVHHHHRRHHYHEKGGGSLGLQYVPPPEYFVEIEFRNVSIAPTVTRVYIDGGDEVEYNYASMSSSPYPSLKTVPLRVSSFEYVPPPEGLDLVWHEPSNEDTCAECLDLALECVNDVNCRFGLDTYLLGALKQIELARAEEDDYATRIYFTDIFRTAQSYFPDDGYKKLSNLMTCVATRWPPCNLDYPREERNLADGSISEAEPTHVVIDPAVIEFRADMDAYTYFYTTSGLWYSYYERGDASSFETLVIDGILDEPSRDDFYWKRGGAIFSYNMSWHEDNGSTQDSGSWRSSSSDASVGDSNNGDPSVGEDGNSATFKEMVYHWVSLGYAIEDFPQVWEAAVMYTSSWSIAITTDRSTDKELLDDGPKLQWRRLRDWINMLENDSPSDSSNSGGSSNGSGSGNGWSNNSTIPANGNSICDECMATLSACVSDPECRDGVRATVLPSLVSLLSSQVNEPAPQALTLNLSADWDLWMTNFETEESAKKFTELMVCLSNWGCAVGYSAESSLPGSPRVPTTISMSVETVVDFMPEDLLHAGFSPNSGLNNDYKEAWWGDGIAGFLRSTFAIDYNSVQVYKFELADGSLEYHLIYSKSADRYPQFWDETRTNQLSRTTMSVSLSVDANSAARALSGLLDWFGMKAPGSDAASTNGTSPLASWDPCLECEDKFQRCMENSLCREAAAFDLVPRWLTPPAAYQNSRFFFTGHFGSEDNNRNSIIYSGDLTKALLDMKATLPDEESWVAFVDMFRCLSIVSCDLQYMNDAVAAPATAHSPTNLHFTPANGILTIYPGTQVTLTFGDQVVSYMRSTDVAQGSDPYEFSNWLESAFQQPMLSVSSMEISGDLDEGLSYNINFGDYTGTLPSFTLVETGDPGVYPAPNVETNGWQFTIRSVNVAPAWPKLVDLLSFVAETTPEAEGPYTCDPCRALRSQCLEDYLSQYFLANYLVPVLAQASNSYYTSPDNNLHVSDVTNDVIYYVLRPRLFATDDNIKVLRLLDLLKCSDGDHGLGAECITASSESAIPGTPTQAKLVAHSPYSELALPVSAPGGVRVSFMGYWDAWSDANVFDYYGDVDALVQFISNLPIDGGSATVSVQTSETEQLHRFRVEYQYSLYDLVVGMLLPHFVAKVDPSGGDIANVASNQLSTYAESTQDWLRFVLQSTVTPLTAPFDPWIQWLQGINAN